MSSALMTFAYILHNPALNTVLSRLWASSVTVPWIYQHLVSHSKRASDVFGHLRSCIYLEDDNYLCLLFPFLVACCIQFSIYQWSF